MHLESLRRGELVHCQHEDGDERCPARTRSEPHNLWTRTGRRPYLRCALYTHCRADIRAGRTSTASPSWTRGHPLLHPAQRALHPPLSHYRRARAPCAQRTAARASTKLVLAGQFRQRVLILRATVVFSAQSSCFVCHHRLRRLHCEARVTPFSACI